MKPMKKTRISLLLLLAISVSHISGLSQDSAITGKPAVKVSYFVNNDRIPYLLVESVLKKGKKYEALPRRQVKVFLDSIGTGNLLNEVTTDEKGKARVVMPASLQSLWKSNATHNFIAVLNDTSAEEERTAMLEIIKARMTIDTLTDDGIRYLNVKVIYLDNDEWMPAKDVELRVGVRRAGGILSAGEETYTTDSTGFVAAEFTVDSLPGDELGNFVVTARIDDNELYGNLLAEKTVPWGKVVKRDTGFFDQRTLWSTAFRAPTWLLFMAYSIVIIVWGTLIYLVVQIVKIKKLGTR